MRRSRSSARNWRQGSSRSCGTDFFVRAPLRCVPASQNQASTPTRENRARWEPGLPPQRAKAARAGDPRLAGSSCARACGARKKIHPSHTQHLPLSFYRKMTALRKRSTVLRTHSRGGCATRAWKILKRHFQNRLVLESGFVKMYYFAPLLRRFFVDGTTRFAYNSHQLQPCKTAGHRWVHRYGRFWKLLGTTEERHRRGNPERPATLWTVAYRLGPSFRGL
jgi:hypothetical protein